MWNAGWSLGYSELSDGMRVMPRNPDRQKRYGFRRFLTCWKLPLCITSGINYVSLLRRVLARDKGRDRCMVLTAGWPHDLPFLSQSLYVVPENTVLIIK
jgi:hypothetical protein